MKNINEYRDGTYESYLQSRAEKVTSLKNIMVNDKQAQQMDFYKATHTDGTTVYYIGIVYRGYMSDYYKKRSWIEYKYVVTKEEGNAIYKSVKASGTYNNTELKEI